MERKVSLHVELFFKNICGIWTHDPWDKKKKNHLVWWGIELGAVWSKKQASTNELRLQTMMWTLYQDIRNQYFETVLANFSQLPPICANWHLYYINIYNFSQLFSLYDMSEPEWAMIKNVVFGSYLWDQ